MHLISKEGELSNSRVECRHCKWQGLFSELKQGDYLLLSNITEVFCPSCEKYIGFIQHVGSNEEE